MEMIFAVSVVLLLLFLGGGLWWSLQRLSQKLEASQVQGQSLQMMQTQLESLRGQVSDQLSRINEQLVQSQDSIGQRLDNAAKVVGEVQKSLGGLGQATAQVVKLGETLNKEISSLQGVFQPPKMRGGIGEVLLSNLLAEVLPREHYELQYGFKTRSVVDAVIRLPEGMVPVDAKFPLENFRKFMEEPEEKAKAAARREFTRDVRKHIDAISEKYILPDEGTLDFALMYIPAENVYYEVILRGEEGEKEIYQYSISKKVIPVSPNSFYAYLSALVRGFRGLKIAEKAQEILAGLDRLSGDFRRFEEDFSLVGKHLSDALKKFQDSEKRLTRFEDKLLSLKEGSPAVSGKEQTLLPG